MKAMGAHLRDLKPGEPVVDVVRASENAIKILARYAGIKEAKP